MLISLEPPSGSNYENLVNEELLYVIVPNQKNLIWKEMIWFIIGAILIYINYHNGFFYYHTNLT